MAGIKVWMLTGDKLETAQNIGFSCRLLNTSQVRLYSLPSSACVVSRAFFLRLPA